MLRILAGLLFPAILAAGVLPPPATVAFSGPPAAELFSKEVSASLQGVLQYNFNRDDSVYPIGFVRASPPPQPWYKTFWTRDGGTFLRELVRWNYPREAGQAAECMIQLVGKNPEGYHAFPRYFESRAPRSGEELDGTSAIIIGMTLLERSLPPGSPVKGDIDRFLRDSASPVKFIQSELRDKPLLAGQGEFGGGMGTKGPYYNVVQNQLAALALTAYGQMEAAAGNAAAARDARASADRLTANLQKYLVGADGAWLWCIDPKTLQPDVMLLNSATNQGFGGINGVLSMTADVDGLQPARTAPGLYAVSLATFQKLYRTPARKRQFDEYGIWTQFDRLAGGTLTSPSYGMGYAIQDMLLSDQPAMAAKALDFLASATYRPVAGYDLPRKSPYYFYERLYSPEAVGRVPLAAGCGALNLVNVAEPLKVARLIIGIDDSDPATLTLLPRVPSTWTGFEARNWPVLTRDGTVLVNLAYSNLGGIVHCHFTATAKIKRLVVRLPKGGGWEYEERTDCDDAAF